MKIDSNIENCRDPSVSRTPATAATEAESDILLQTDGLTKRFGGFTDIGGADSARSGELRCLLGKNGAGKSTLMKTFVGLLEPEAGSARYDGSNVTDLSANKCAKIVIGYIPLNRDVFPDLTVK